MRKLILVSAVALIAVLGPASATLWKSGGNSLAPGFVLEDGNGVNISAQDTPFAGAVAMTVGTTYTTQRSVGVLCTVAGNVVFQFPDASTLTLPVYPGWQTFPFAVTTIVSAGTTATATYFNLK